MNKIVDLRLGGALIPAERRGAATSTTRDCVQTPYLPLCIIIIPTISDDTHISDRYYEGLDSAGSA